MSSGDVLRGLAQEQSERGRALKALMDEGRLIDDAFLEQVLEERLSQEDCSNGFILDGTPRDMDQARMLERFTSIDKAVLITLDEEESLRRVEHRQITEHRSDDTKEALRKRLQVYHEKTEPVIEHFRAEGKLVEVDGNQSVSDVFADICRRIGLSPQ